MAKKVFFFISLFLLLFYSCQTNKRWQTSTLLFFDTVCEIRLYCSPSEFREAQSEVYGIFSEIEKNFSPTSKENSSAMVLDLFQRSLKIYHQTNGCFDLTVGPLLKIWGFYNRSYRIPDPQQINSTLKLVGMDKVKIQNNSLCLLPGMSLDWGGIAKGWGVDLASKSLIKKGVSKGFINSGGDLYCWGKNPEDKPWKIGIQHPRREGYLGVISISNLGASTTGDYRRYFVHRGTRYHHVFNPQTGYPARGKQSVTVVGPEALLCDALSTALFVSKNPQKLIHKYPQYGAIIVNSKGEIIKIGKKYPFRSL